MEYDIYGPDWKYLPPRNSSKYAQLRIEYFEKQGNVELVKWWEEEKKLALKKEAKAKRIREVRHD